MGKKTTPGMMIFKTLASLKLTVLLFAMSIFLVVAGTLAQRFVGNWEVVNDYFRSLIVNIPIRDIMPDNSIFSDSTFSFPFPGGALLGTLVLINLMAAFIATFKFNRKRLGILVIHSGLVLLLAGEFATGILAVESQMLIPEGSYANFSEDIREVELAIVDKSDPVQDLVIPIPQSVLVNSAKNLRPITQANLAENAIAKLPFDIRIDQYLSNAILVPLSEPRLPKDWQNPATYGLGLTEYASFPIPDVTGTDVEQKVNTPSIYLTISNADGRSETLLLFSRFDMPHTFTVGEKVYELSLRFKRLYKPYTIHLTDFRFDRFVGTNIPRNYSSDIILKDPTNNEERPVKIWMNHPLRYRGETFFQSSFTQDEKGTVLQVVDNPGWTVPYISSAIMSLGLLLHFGLMFTKFANRQTQAEKKVKKSPLDESAKLGHLPKKYVIATTIVALLVCTYIYAPLMQKPAQPSDVAKANFARLPVTAEGRVKPMDSFARATMIKLMGKQTFKDEQGNKQDGNTFLLDFITNPQVAVKHKVFRIDNPDIKAMLGVTDDKVKYFSIEQLQPFIEQIVTDAQEANKIPDRQRSLYQNNAIVLASNLSLLADVQAMRTPYLIPPSDQRDWEPITDPITRTIHDKKTDVQESVAYWQNIFSSYAGTYNAESTLAVQSQVSFSQSVNAYTEYLEVKHEPMVAKSNFEFAFNKMQPFYHGIVLYAIVFFLAIFTLVVSLLKHNTDRPRSNFLRFLARTAVVILVITFLLHTFAIASRIYITGRPPVTNLYSSAVFVGWFAIIMAMLMERFFKNLIPTLAASVIGMLTLILAHNLATGDTMQMMQAVLDSNFWLTTHVITITIGYSAVFLAGLFAIIYIVQGVYTKSLTKERARTLTTMIYATTAFALFFSFVGTVLGGIWADQSWGRFWGWDPKENGAVLIVLITALILHARWGGLIQQRGIAVLAIGGNIICAFSWFGTNLLGAGLHSYGFMESGFFWLWIFIASQVAMMSVGMMPIRSWASAPNFLTPKRKPPRIKQPV
ncbi:Cytochrome c biogenesis protein CcsA [Poriferisphaera corsica]|uniref:Cytochrome c biogenesis protein CcsA n=1 Tax=Poriferisphaera corsica TaxID=2528020 RepID=A0A517YV17_9BACT|nr:cytochrome c biogenesis protein CcsA [Poriferisphaera corsica]QDU34089.1 Cytochrome c biogenesis protein CcsA [Poriferisphaera corsica]